MNIFIQVINKYGKNSLFYDHDIISNTSVLDNVNIINVNPIKLNNIIQRFGFNYFTIYDSLISDICIKIPWKNKDKYAYIDVPLVDLNVKLTAYTDNSELSFSINLSESINLKQNNESDLFNLVKELKENLVTYFDNINININIVKINLNNSIQIYINNILSTSDNIEIKNINFSDMGYITNIIYHRKQKEIIIDDIKLYANIFNHIPLFDFTGDTNSDFIFNIKNVEIIDHFMLTGIIICPNNYLIVNEFYTPYFRCFNNNGIKLTLSDEYIFESKIYIGANNISNISTLFDNIKLFLSSIPIKFDNKSVSIFKNIDIDIYFENISFNIFIEVSHDNIFNNVKINNNDTEIMISKIYSQNNKYIFENVSVKSDSFHGKSIEIIYCDDKLSVKQFNIHNFYNFYIYLKTVLSYLIIGDDNDNDFFINFYDGKLTFSDITTVYLHLVNSKINLNKGIYDTQINIHNCSLNNEIISNILIDYISKSEVKISKLLLLYDLKNKNIISFINEFYNYIKTFIPNNTINKSQINDNINLEKSYSDFEYEIISLEQKNNISKFQNYNIDNLLINNYYDNGNLNDDNLNIIINNIRIDFIDGYNNTKELCLVLHNFTYDYYNNIHKIFIDDGALIDFSCKHLKWKNIIKLNTHNSVNLLYDNGNIELYTNKIIVNYCEKNIKKIISYINFIPLNNINNSSKNNINFIKKMVIGNINISFNYYPEISQKIDMNTNLLYLKKLKFSFNQIEILNKNNTDLLNEIIKKWSIDFDKKNTYGFIKNINIFYGCHEKIKLLLKILFDNIY